MQSLGTYAPDGQSSITPEDQVVLEYRRRMVCIELYALAVLIGLGLASVYVIGTLILKCIAG